MDLQVDDRGHDYSQVYEAVADLLDNPRWDDGSYGPLLVRLAWHASGTYDKVRGTLCEDQGGAATRPVGLHPGQLQRV
eukprot:363732-Chlamydomonas_euryale.AAC.9